MENFWEDEIESADNSFQKTKQEITNIKKAQRQIINEDYIINYEDDTLKYVLKPIGQALKRGRPPIPEDQRAKPNDRIVCNLCKKEFVRANRSHHNKTERHKLYERINKKFTNLVLD